jgi:hypothetical protein
MSAVLAQFIVAQTGLDTLDDGTTTTLLARLTSAVTLAAAAASIGKHTVWVPSNAIVTRTTNGALQSTAETATNKQMYRSLDFDQAINQYGQFTIQMPKSWDEGTVTALMVWGNDSGAGNAVWGIQGAAISDTDALDSAFGAARSVTQAGSVGNLIRSAETAAITIGNTPTVNDVVKFQVFRDAANSLDTLTATAHLYGVALFYITSAANDA